MNNLDVSVVVIGYNEEANLASTFDAIMAMDYTLGAIEVIYVDSASSDNSVAIAQGYTDKVFIEKEFPSAGRNRNRGLLEAKYDIVHFVDGDVIIAKDYLQKSVPIFKQKDVQAIVGQLDEQNPNIFNAMAALTNEKKEEGYAHFTSTGATYLKSALWSVNGYDERIKRGQEIELGERFRAAGFKIWCTSDLMASHNFDIDHLWAFANISKKNAISLVQVALLTGSGSYFEKARKLLKKQYVKLALFLVFLMLSLGLRQPLFLLFYLLLAWGSRVKSLVRKRLSEEPKLTILRITIEFFFSWLWWIGLLGELLRYFTDRTSKQFYALRKSTFVQ